MLPSTPHLPVPFPHRSQGQGGEGICPQTQPGLAGLLRDVASQGVPHETQAHRTSCRMVGHQDQGGSDLAVGLGRGVRVRFRRVEMEVPVGRPRGRVLGGWILQLWGSVLRYRFGNCHFWECSTSLEGNA